MQDFWTPEFESLLAGTNTEMADSGVGWVMIAPPWDYATVDPEPDLTWDVDGPTYSPDDLLLHITALPRGRLRGGIAAADLLFAHRGRAPQ